MSGEAPGLLERATSSRTQARLVVAAAYLVAVVLLMGSCWLFLSNADQLWPKAALKTTEDMQSWRTEEHVREFAGGCWHMPAFWRSINLTFVTATATMLIAGLVGIPASYALSRYKIPGRGVIDVLFSSVIVLPSSSVGLCLLIVFQYGPLFELQQRLGIVVPYTLPAIVVVQLVLSLAMGMSVWRAAFDGVNPRFEHVARSLGSSPWRAFWTVTLPSAKTGIIAGLILAWTRAAAEFGGVLLFCGTFSEQALERFGPATRALQLHRADPLAVNMWVQIEYGNVEYGFAIGFVLVSVSAI
ncbi:ABC transporter permease, partial [bacterium]|nr:ABC transporter permease [bacterium]